MGELLIRTGFAILLIALYLIISHFSHSIDPQSSQKFELKVILPLLSLVFLDYWLRMFSHFMVSIKLRDKLITREKLILNFEVNYTGKKPLRFAFRSTTGMPHTNLELIAKNYADYQTKNTSVPEDFIVNLNQIVPSIGFSLVYHFKDVPRGKMVIPLFKHSLYLFVPKLTFKVGDRKKRKKLYILKRYRKEELHGEKTKYI